MAERQYTLVFDAREKQPLLFPKTLAVGNPYKSHTVNRVRLNVVERTILTGDYVLAGRWEKCGCVERKKHLSELADNLFDRRKRKNFEAELERLREYSRPLILVEEAPHRSRQIRRKVPIEAVRDELIRVSFRYEIPVSFASATTQSQRRALGEWVAAFLIQAASEHADAQEH